MINHQRIIGSPVDSSGSATLEQGLKRQAVRRRQWIAWPAAGLLAFVALTATTFFPNNTSSFPRDKTTAWMEAALKNDSDHNSSDTNQPNKLPLFREYQVGTGGSAVVEIPTGGGILSPLAQPNIPIIPPLPQDFVPAAPIEGGEEIPLVPGNIPQ